MIMIRIIVFNGNNNKVQGIPTVVILDGSANVITKDGSGRNHAENKFIMKHKQT